MVDIQAGRIRRQRKYEGPSTASGRMAIAERFSGLFDLDMLQHLLHMGHSSEAFKIT
jgi:hypothetical protein